MAYLLPAVFCGGGMALCMWLMSRGQRKDQHLRSGAGEASEVAELRREVERLRGEVEKNNRSSA